MPSNENDQTVTENAEVPDYPLIPCRVYVCEASETPYPTYIPGLTHVYRRDDQTGMRWENIISVIDNYAKVWDENNGDWVRIHPDNADRSCDWCEEPIVDALVDSYTLRVMRRHGQYLCWSCRDDAYSCESCSCYVHCDNVYHINDGDACYCESCFDDVTTSCEYCDTVYHVDDEPQCGCRSGMILNYSDKFRPLLMHSVGANNELVRCAHSMLPDRERNNIFMGLEFEMENVARNKYTHEIAEIFRDAYDLEQLMLKHDGSISDGFELVTQPHTLDAFMHHFPWDLIREAQSQGMRGWDVGHREIGIHVHINRKAFYTKPEHNRRNASPHLMGFMTFIYKNVPSIKRIAGRNVQYGHMSEQYLEEAYRICRYGESQYRRTLAINLQNNDTVELRMFRSTMRVERVQAYLQFVEAAVRYTQTDRVSKMRDRFNFRQFATWCSFQERYEQLNKLIQETNAIDYARPISLENDTITVDSSDEFVPSDADRGN